MSAPLADQGTFTDASTAEELLESINWHIPCECRPCRRRPRQAAWIHWIHFPCGCRRYTLACDRCHKFIAWLFRLAAGTNTAKITCRKCGAYHQGDIADWLSWEPIQNGGSHE